MGSNSSFADNHTRTRVYVNAKYQSVGKTAKQVNTRTGKYACSNVVCDSNSEISRQANLTGLNRNGINQARSTCPDTFCGKNIYSVLKHEGVSSLEGKNNTCHINSSYCVAYVNKVCSNQL